MQDFFSLFDLPRSFDSDLASLEKAYFAAQREYHPDRLIGKLAEERQYAISRSMLINEAYEALKSPLGRARHLLALEGIDLQAVKPAPTLLLEIMELRETLAEAQTKDAIERLVMQQQDAYGSTLDALKKAFANSAADEAAQLTMRLSYLEKLGEEIRVRAKSIVS